MVKSCEDCGTKPTVQEPFPFDGMCLECAVRHDEHYSSFARGVANALIAESYYEQAEKIVDAVASVFGVGGPNDYAPDQRHEAVMAAYKIIYKNLYDPPKTEGVE